MIYYENGVVYRTLDFLGYPKYRVGIDGSIWSYRQKGYKRFSWKLLNCKTFKSHTGYSAYKIVYLSNAIKTRNKLPKLSNKRNGKEFLVHRLVLLAFTGPPKENEECCHYDDNGLNNHLDNLRWGSKAENHDDRIRNFNLGVSSNTRLVLTTSDVVFIKQSKLKTRELSKIFHVSPAHIRHIKTNKVWKHIK